MRTFVLLLFLELLVPHGSIGSVKVHYVPHPVQILLYVWQDCDADRLSKTFQPRLGSHHFNDLNRKQ